MNRNSPAIQHQSYRQAWEAIEKIKAWTGRIESSLQTDPGGVIAYVALHSLSEAVGDLLYASGHVNAIILAADRPSVQLPVDPSLPGGG